MMFVALKSGLAARLLPLSGNAKELCKILPKNNLNKIQVASLTRAAYRDESEVPNIKPFPYHNTEYNTFTMLFRDTYKCRIHKHTKLIVIDGPVASGKQDLAKKLAKELDFLYLPQPTFDDLFITHWGFDVRTLDHKLPDNVKTWDIERFCKDPSNRLTIPMQFYMLLLRSKRYIDCLCHLFCTGQGVVTVRSPWSDSVFTKAMRKSHYISQAAMEAHEDSCRASFFYYLKPHLVIYLDVPVDQTIENIRKNGEPFEKNSKALTEEYLTNVEQFYKRDYLSYLSEHSLMLVYDWSQGGDSEVVLEDIESLDFEKYTNPDTCGHETLLEDWRMEQGEWKYYTKLYSYEGEVLLKNLDIMRFDVPEMNITGNEMEAWYKVWNEVPDSQYHPGYNIYKGDKDLLWKTKFILNKDYVTPLMEKYNERKAREQKKR